MRSIALSSLIASAMMIACGDDRGSTSQGSATAVTGASQGSSTSTSESAGTSGSGSDSAAATSTAGDTLKIDVGFDTSSGETDGPAVECPNVDILFVIDNSGSMADQQESLIASFDGFVQGIQENLVHTESFHVGVVTSDAYGGNDPKCSKIGELVTKTGGPDSSNQLCLPFASGRRFLDEGELDLASKFACIGKVGTGGNDDEKMARAMLDALSPAKSAPGACNEDFHREDSLTVVVLITDEDDVPEPYGCDPNDFFDNKCDTVGSLGTPDDWYAELLSYKAGIKENVVVLSLLGQTGDNACGAVAASKLIGFTNRWGDHGFTGDVCAASYDAFFAEALPVVDEACAGYVPPPR